VTSTPRRTTRFRPIHFVLSLLLALVGVVAIGGPAQAAGSTISGTVTTPALTAGIPVYLSYQLTGPGPAFDLTTPITGTDANGDFSFAGVPAGNYLVVVDDGDNWVQFPAFVTADGVTDPSPVIVDLQPGVAIYGTVKDAEVPFNALPYITVAAIGDSGGFPFFDWLSLDVSISLPPFGGIPLTGVSGQYRIVVPLDDTYEVAAFDLSDTYDQQAWFHHNFGSGGLCGCDLFDPISVPDILSWPHAPVTGIDFDLLNMSNWIDVSVYANDLNGDPLDQVLIHLDRKTGPATWDLDIDTELTDVDGYADVFALGDGDYRLRYSVGGVFKAIDSWYESSFGAWPLSDSGFSVELDGLLTAGCGCGGYSTYYPELVFPLTASGGGGSTPGTPRKPHTTFSSLTAPTPSATPTPTPTPTSSPSPSSSPSGEPSASPEPTIKPEPTGNALTGLWWLWLILAAILALIIVFLVRLVRGRA
jgi:hypothetical protein